MAWRQVERVSFGAEDSDRWLWGDMQAGCADSTENSRVRLTEKPSVVCCTLLYSTVLYFSRLHRN